MEGVEGTKRCRFQFSVNMAGSCFLCFQTAQQKLISTTYQVEVVEDKEEDDEIQVLNKDGTPASVTKIKIKKEFKSYSFRNLCRFIGVNLCQVISVPPEILPLLRMADIRVSLCEQCGELNERFSKAYQEMELTRLRVEGYVKEIHERFEEEFKYPERVEEYKKGMMENQQALFHSGMVQKLRKETREKCLFKIQRALPRVKMKRKCYMKENKQNTGVTHISSVTPQGPIMLPLSKTTPSTQANISNSQTVSFLSTLSKSNQNKDKDKSPIVHPVKPNIQSTSSRDDNQGAAATPMNDLRQNKPTAVVSVNSVAPTLPKLYVAGIPVQNTVRNSNRSQPSNPVRPSPPPSSNTQFLRQLLITSPSPFSSTRPCSTSLLSQQLTDSSIGTIRQQQTQPAPKPTQAPQLSSFKCPSCQKEFPNFVDLRLHEYEAHTTKAVPKLPTKTVHHPQLQSKKINSKNKTRRPSYPYLNDLLTQPISDSNSTATLTTPLAPSLPTSTPALSKQKPGSVRKTPNHPSQRNRKRMIIGNKIWNCFLCSAKFTAISALELHQTMVHQHQPQQEIVQEAPMPIQTESQEIDCVGINITDPNQITGISLIAPTLLQQQQQQIVSQVGNSSFLTISSVSPVTVVQPPQLELPQVQEPLQVGYSTSNNIIINQSETEIIPGGTTLLQSYLTGQNIETGTTATVAMESELPLTFNSDNNNDNDLPLQIILQEKEEEMNTHNGNELKGETVFLDASLGADELLQQIPLGGVEDDLLNDFDLSSFNLDSII